MFHLIFGVPWLIVAARFILPLPWSWALKIALAVVLLLVSQYHLFSRLSSGSVFSPEFPRPLILAFNLLLGAMLMLAVFQLVLDAVSLVLLAIKGSFPVVPAGVRYAIGGLALALSAFGVSQAILVPQTKDIQVTIPGLPAAFDGYHADVAPLSGLRARDGVLAIPGNHEYFFGYEAWMRYFQGLNMQILANGHAVIARGGESLVIAGVTDHSAARTGMPAPDVRAALAGAPEGAPVILLDHQPRNAVDASTTRVALQLSGHTHGGMVLGLDRLVANANNGFVSGFYRVGAMQLYVNNGTALWPGFALRLGRPSELTRITLRSSR